MRIMIFIAIVLTILGFAGYYVYVRTAQSFSGTFVTSKPVLILYIFLMSSFFVGKIIEIYSIGVVSITFIRIGSVGISYFLYALLFAAFFDIIRLINYIIPFYPAFVTADYQKTKNVIGVISFITISVLFVYGYINARNPKVTELDIAINKSEHSFDTLNVVAVSDIHLGIAVNETKTKRLIAKINELKPDLIIIGGDIIDDNLNVVKHFKLLNYFKELNPKYGIYSCLGNHEYISRAYTDLDYFEKNKIHFLKDTAVKIDNKFYIIGRDDVEARRITGKERKSMAELTENIDFTLPVFLIDHQPFGLEKTAEHAIDLQFSGHTHNGQIWPFNYITGLIFEEDWGYLKKKNTHFYISSGYGTAVIPIKIGNYSEIVNIKITNR